MFGLGKFLHLRLQGANIDTPTKNLGDLFGTDKGTQTTQSSQTPWGPLQPYLLDAFQRGQSLSNRAPYGFKPSSFTTQAQQLQAQRAVDPNSLTSKAQGVLGETLSGKFLNPQTNPAFQSAMSDALGQAASTFAGQYGGQAGANLSNSGYQEALARGLGSAATNAYANAFQSERQNQLGALALAPEMDYANIGALADVGAQQEARDYSQYMSPWSNLQMFGQALSPGLGFNQGTNQTPYYVNNTANTLGTVGTIAGIAMF